MRGRTSHMSSSESFKNFILDQTQDAGVMRARNMFSEYCLYCNDKLVGVISDDKLFIKPTPELEAILKTKVLLPPYEGAKPNFFIAEVDDRDYITKVIKTAYETIPDKPYKPKRRRSQKF